MQYYLVNMDKGTYFDAQNDNEKVPRLAQYDQELTTVEQEKVDYDANAAAKHAAERLQKISVWTEVNEFDPMDKDEKSRIKKEHEERLKRYR